MKHAKIIFALFLFIKIDALAQQDAFSKVRSTSNACFANMKNRLLGPMLVEGAMPVTNYKASVGDLKEDMHEMVEGEEFYKNLKDLWTKSNQIYLNQTLYNWMMFEKRFTNLQSGKGLSLSKSEWKNARIIQGIDRASILFDSQKNQIRSITSFKMMSEEIKFANEQIKSINNICRSHHATFVALQKVHETKMYSERFNPGVTKLLFPNGKSEFQIYVGGADGVVRDRMKQERANGAVEAAYFQFILSQSSMGTLLNIETDLQDHVGVWNALTCVESGKQLKTIPENDIFLIYNSAQQVRKRFKGIVNDRLKSPPLVPMDPSQVTAFYQKHLKRFIRENPLSIMGVFMESPNQQQALITCYLIQSLENSREFKEAVAPIVMLVGLVGSAFTGPTIAILAGFINFASLTTAVVDLVNSYSAEHRIQGAILAKQIPIRQANEIIYNLRAQRAFSYVNSVLAGAGAVSNIVNINKYIKNYNQYIYDLTVLNKASNKMLTNPWAVSAELEEINLGFRPKNPVVVVPTAKIKITTEQTLSHQEIEKIKNWIIEPSPKTNEMFFTKNKPEPLYACSNDQKIAKFPIPIQWWMGAWMKCRTQPG